MHERITHWNAHYHFSIRKVFIKNHKSRWGSCSEKGNLNFNYKLIYLPRDIADYIIVHDSVTLRNSITRHVFGISSSARFLVIRRSADAYAASSAEKRYTNSVKTYKIKARVMLFPGDAAWYFAGLDKKQSEKIKRHARDEKTGDSAQCA